MTTDQAGDKQEENLGGGGTVVPLRSTSISLLEEAKEASAGRAARTVLAVPGLRVTMLALAAGQELAEHEAPGAATITCLRGRFTLAAGDREWVLREDDLVEIPAQRHKLIAVTDGVALLTVRL